MKTRQFRIYPDNHFVYFEVTIHRTITALRKSGRNMSKALGYHVPSLGIFVPAEGKGDPYYTGLIGEIHYCDRYLTMGIIAHEICHATFEYFDLRKRCRLGHGYRGNTGRGHVDEREEAWCWINGNLNWAFWIMMEHLKNGHKKYDLRAGRQYAIRPIREKDLPKRNLR